MDGNTAAAYISYPFTEVAAIFPITPSSPMAELVDAWASEGRKNIFGQPVRVVEMQSEGGAAGALHGSLQGGSLTTTYTASQGLLLMIPNMYKIAGELLPAVFHVSARSLASNSLSIFGDQQDVLSTRQTGFAMLASSSVQDTMFLGAVAHLAAIKSRIPFLHFFDGFRTSHEIQKIEVLEYDELASLIDMDAVRDFRARSLNPDHPALVGMTQNPDIFFQLREATNPYYDALPDIVEACMNDINRLTGRDYRFFNYTGAPDAENVIICMGSGAAVVEETVESLVARGEKVGVVNVHLYRPFLPEHLLKELPDSVRRIAVLDRTKEPGGADPLLLDVRNAFYGTKNAPLVVGGRYGLASKDFTPDQVLSVLDNLKAETPRDSFTIGIEDDVTHHSLPLSSTTFTPVSNETFACKFWGYGSDGTVGANKSAIKIIGDHTDMYAQAYFAYDSKKSGGLTVSHLRFGPRPIKSSYLVSKADFVACHNQAYIGHYDMLADLKPGGIFLLNCMWTPEELERHLPADVKRAIAQKNVRFHIIHAVGIGREIGIGSRINMIMQAAFFRLTGIIPAEDAEKYLRDAVIKSYGKQGQAVIDMNFEAIRRGMTDSLSVTVPESWKHASEAPVPRNPAMPAFIHDVVNPMNRQQGDALPVSTFADYADGHWPVGITAWEKRGVAVYVPQWKPDSCIQCNQCAYVCPHAVIRPRLLSSEETLAAPEGFRTVSAKGSDVKGLNFHLAISALDCTGCGVCVNACPAKDKALEMVLLDDIRDRNAQDWAYSNDRIEDRHPDGKITVKTSQFLRPLQEFSGACPGCGETPYAKLITQLFGDRMMISNAAGCSTVWAAGAPSVSYTTNRHGHGPAWGFSLFEDCAEYGFGMALGVRQQRTTLAARVQEALTNDLPGGSDGELTRAMRDWLEHLHEGDGTRTRARRLEMALTAVRGTDPHLDAILAARDFFVKRSHWIFGGDGWAYDIGYGGLDHVLASGEDVNVLVFDTEVYSNTGGQSSKATPTGAIAQFAAGGKTTKKKNLGLMAMSYGDIYVAQIALGADKAQTLKALMEAESYPGPSLVIAYSPCINHGIKGGLAVGQDQAKRAVEAGYWNLYRFDPRRKDKGALILDSKAPTGDFRQHLMTEVRYAALTRKDPEKAEKLFSKAAQEARERFLTYERLAGK